MKARVIAAIAIFVALVVILTVVRQRSSGDASVHGRIDRFLSCLPDTLREEQRGEVRSTLEHFQRLIDDDMVAKKDRDDIFTLMDRYIEAGSITKQELHVFLAKVGYYSIRMTPENRDIDGKMKAPDHPLLEKSGEVDSTSYR